VSKDEFRYATGRQLVSGDKFRPLGSLKTYTCTGPRKGKNFDTGEIVIVDRLDTVLIFV